MSEYHIRYGGYGGIGYHYPGQTYSGRFTHAKPISSCVSCHSPHSLKVDTEVCLTCHKTGEAADIRISRVSYDGSGDTSKGIRADIKTNADRLITAIQDYARQVVGTPILYEAGRYPYFFADANDDGLADQSDGRAVAYNAWTPRLLKAVYNWKVATTDKGIHVHNPPYALELIYDSLSDLAEPFQMDMSDLGMLR